MKKILAIMLSVMMILCMMPGMAFADDASKTAITSIAFENPNAAYTYTGSEIRPAIVVKAGNTTVSSLYYDVAWSNNTAVGTNASATVTMRTGADVPYEIKTGSNVNNVLTFEIKQQNINNVTLTVPPTVAVGTNISALQFTLKNGSVSLVKGTDYEITAAADAKVVKGAQQVTITGKGNYTGTRSIRVNGGTDLSTANYAIQPIADQRYDGTAKAPAVVVKDSNNNILSSTNYTVTYSDNINVGGNATVTVTGKGDYAGTLTKTFNILPKSISYVTVAPIDNQVVNVVPKPVIKDGAKTLVEGQDYTLSYANYDLKGTATVYIDGINNYEGQITRTYAVKDSLTANAFSLLQTSYEYTGSVIKPEVLVTSSSKYREGVDYKLVYDTSSKVEANKKVQVVGIGNYGGVAAEFTYSITPKALNDKDATVTLPASAQFNGGKAIEPSVSVACGGRTLVKGTDYTVTYLNNTNIGTATVYIYGIGNYSGSVYKTFKILGQDISGFTATLSQTTYQYTGTEHKPAVTLYNGTIKLVNGTDYKVTYKNNKNSGTATAVIEGIGNYSGTKNVNFTINGKTQELTTDYTYYTKYLTSADFNLGATTNGDGVITYETSDPTVATVSANGTVTIEGTGKAVITVKTTNDVKFNPEVKSVYVTVKPKKPTFKITTPAKGQAKVTITKVDGATKYQVKYGRSGSYKDKYITHKDNGYKTTYVTLKNLKPGTTYYVKVRSYKTLADGTKVWGNWTTVKKVKVK